MGDNDNEVDFMVDRRWDGKFSSREILLDVPYYRNIEMSILAAILNNKQLVVQHRSRIKSAFFDDVQHAALIELCLDEHDNKGFDSSPKWSQDQHSRQLLETVSMDRMEVLQDFPYVEKRFEEYLGKLQERYQLSILLRASHRVLNNQGLGFQETYKILKAALEEADNNSAETLSFSEEQSYGSYQMLEYLNDCQKYVIDKEPMPKRMSTGYKKLDYLLGDGYKKGRLYLCAARPGMGKTSFAVNQLYRVSRCHKVLFITYEVARNDIRDQVVSIISGIATQDISNFKITPDDVDRCAKIITEQDMLNRECSYWIEQPKDKGVGNCVELMAFYKRKYDVDFVIIDHIHHMGGGKSNNFHEKYSEIVSQITAATNNLDVGVLLLAQLSRKVEERLDKAPLLSDLRESGSLEECADCVLMLHRPEYYEEFKRPKELDIFIRKNRDGTAGKVVMNFDGATKQIQDK